MARIKILKEWGKKEKSNGFIDREHDIAKKQLEEKRQINGRITALPVNMGGGC